MSKKLKFLLIQDIKEIIGLINFKENGLSCQIAQNIARGIILNLENHLSEYIYQKSKETENK